MITALVICWTFASFMLVGWAIKYERNRKKENKKKKDNRKLLKD